MNTKKYKNCSSKMRGVDFHKKRKKWRARIRSNGVSKYLGLFETEEEAALAYKKAAKELHGMYARVTSLS